MTEMLVRVALEIAREIMEDYGPAIVWDDVNGDTQDRAISRARRIFEVLSEPTPEMADAGAFTGLSHSYGGDTHSFDYLSADDACDCWRSMLGAALRKGQ